MVIYSGHRVNSGNNDRKEAGGKRTRRRETEKGGKWKTGKEERTGGKKGQKGAGEEEWRGEGEDDISS